MNLVIRDMLQAGEGDLGVPTGVSIPHGAGAEPVVRPGPPGSAWTFTYG